MKPQELIHVIDALLYEHQPTDAEPLVARAHDLTREWIDAQAPEPVAIPEGERWKWGLCRHAMALALCDECCAERGLTQRGFPKEASLKQLPNARKGWRCRLGLHRWGPSFRVGGSRTARNCQACPRQRSFP